MSEKAETSKPVARQSLYFHLLGDDDIDQLKGLLEAIRERHAEVTANWYRVYALHFGDSRSFSQKEFASLWDAAMVGAEEDLLRRNIHGYIQKQLRLGDELAHRHVGLQELIASLHLFEQATRAVLPADALPGDRAHELFGKLNHVAMILLVDAYVRSQTSLAASRISALELEAEHLAPSERVRFRGLVGKSAAMRQLYRDIEMAAALSRPVTVVGAPGTERELVAHAIHESSANARAPFVELDCAALPEDLIDAELFGYHHEGFNGSARQYLGLLRAADGGTLFFNEFVKAPLCTQKRLLRTIREGLASPVGSTEQVPVSIRVIASTTHGVSGAIRSGHLDRALYRELSATVLTVPPLRERIEDLPLLAQNFIDLFNDRFDRAEAPVGIAEDALEAMARYPWPGNVRELGDLLASAFMSASSSNIRLEDILSAMGGATAQARYQLPTLAEAERDLIIRALSLSGGNKSSAARILKISRKKLYAKLGRYGLEPPTEPGESDPGQVVA